MVHDTVRSDRRTEAQTQLELELPSVADIQCTQNAGHGVVNGRAIDVPRTSVRDALMTDGEPMPSVKAAG